MSATWLTVLAWLALAVAGLCAAVVLVDIYGAGRRQPMTIMEVVWPVTALYLGPVALWVYVRYGRGRRPTAGARHDADGGDEPTRDRPGWVPVFTGVAHCGGGCTLGDIVAETAVFALGIEVFASAFAAELIGDYVLALALGIVFQYFAIAPMRGLGLRDGLVAAAKADVLSLTAFEVGLFGWMAITRFVLFADAPLRPDSAAYWFLMQLGMALGFVTAWPMNVLLIRRGVKEAM